VTGAGLPLPQVNQWLGDKEVDFVWPEHDLIAEIDGYADHGGPNALRTDRKRDRELKLKGWEVLRFTWADVTDDPQEVVRTLEAFLR
jgi:very-short-patch-repair endonuclease